jgi:quinol monooxygenase YgiN
VSDQPPRRARLRVIRRSPNSAILHRSDIAQQIRNSGNWVLIEAWEHRQRLLDLFFAFGSAEIRAKLQSMWEREVEQLRRLPESTLPRWLVEPFSLPLGTLRSGEVWASAKPTTFS